MVVRREGNRSAATSISPPATTIPPPRGSTPTCPSSPAGRRSPDDVTALFNTLTGFAEVPSWKRLAVAPLGLQARVIHLIDREAKRARAGEPARIIAKLNALVDADVIRALYAASQAGVEIDLLVRGICCLRPGVPGCRSGSA